MQTEFIKLAVIFIVIMVMVLAKLKLRDAMIAAILLTVILFGIPLGDAAKLMIQSVYEKDTLLVVGSFILVTFLQRIMENRKLLERAEMALQRLSGDRRMVCVIAPVIIGFLPSAGAVNICGAIVDKATGKDLDVEEKTFVTSYYRHIMQFCWHFPLQWYQPGNLYFLWRRWLWCFWYWDMYFICGSFRKDMKQVRMK